MVWLIIQVYNHHSTSSNREGGSSLKASLDESQPIFQQIAQIIMDEIIDGYLQEEEKIPSENELSRFYNINRATVRNGLQSLVDAELIYKQRGIGMFVKKGAKKKLLAERQKKFGADYLLPMMKEAERIGLSSEAVIEMIDEEVKK
jgi:GntR family transcriptional regulator